MPGAGLLMLFGGVLFVAGLFMLPLVGFWGLPVLVAGLLLGLAYLKSARRTDPSAGTLERGRQAEPTGVPRKSPSGGAETANERVGQTR